MRGARQILATTIIVTAAWFPSCATSPSPPASAPPVAVAPVTLNKPGFYTEVRDGRLWVFRENSKALEEFKKHGEPAQQVTRVGGGPRGMTVKSSDFEVIDAYLTAP